MSTAAPPWGWVGLDAALQPLADPRFATVLHHTELPFSVVRDPQGELAATTSLPERNVSSGLPALALGLPCRASQLGDPTFRRDHRVRYAFYAGAMANGIASEELVEALAKEGLLSIFGAAGLSIERVREAVERLQANLGDRPFGCNLIHSPNEQDLEAAVAQLFIERGVTLVEASAYLDLTPSVVRYRVHGIHEDGEGNIVTPNRVIAKISRVEVATKFLSPPPAKFLERLVADGHITAAQAALASRIPMADDITAEADSGGHTDNRPALALLPAIIALRDRIQAEQQYAGAPRVGLAGGISTPAAAAAAFAMGAAYIVTGTVNQACVESGSSDIVRQMLAEAEQADTAMAPAADMFEMGVEVQVLKRGTMFSMRGARLYELYRQYASIDEIPAVEREKLEKTIFRATLSQVWEDTKAFFQKRDPKQIARAEQDPKHKMALIFRSYLGQASIWANRGETSRKIDFQIWCGPAMGAFNEWVRGTFLDDPKRREAALVNLNILHGAAVVHRCTSLASQGIPVPPACMRYRPLERVQLEEFIR
ncbi:MAG: PfaD family polyunsaturated fatty acid/polyketide biosynthesis protein [Candidatus Hydrogenedentes bacterium]|nr:PfaD family polyunsaturated fatty acid/polyketide biosynthesis protein [Candidatus Hydrogenedentota bacterium]